MREREDGVVRTANRLSDLSRDQRHLLERVYRGPGLMVESRSTAAASLVRKGFVLKRLSRERGPVAGRLAELTITEAGRK